MGTIRERVGKKNAKSYHCQVRRKGCETQTQTFRTKAEAQRWERLIEAEMDSGAFVNRRAAEQTTLLDALKRYSTSFTPQKKSAVSEQSQIRILSALPVARRSLASLRSSDFAALRDGWILGGLKPSSVVRRLALVSHLFNVCRKEWNFTGLHNPLLDVARPEVNDERSRVVESNNESSQDTEDDEADENPVGREALMDELQYIEEATRSNVLKGAMRFASQTAMRRGEVVSLRWEHVNLKTGVANLPSTKNGSARKVPLSPEARQLLKELDSEDKEYVFPVRADALTRAFTRAQARARVRYEEQCRQNGEKPSGTFLIGLRFHDLRHHATTQLAAIFAMHELAKITGHKSTKMLLRYYHPKAEDLAKKFPNAPLFA